MKKKVLIIGAGPAGLTAAYELLKHSDFVPVVFEMDTQVGGISKTVDYKGNKIDIGGHRFFSKSERVMDWWREIMPVEGSMNNKQQIINNVEANLGIENNLKSKIRNSSGDNVMLVRSRLSRILYRRRFFDYPIRLSAQTILNLGVFNTFKIGLSYIKSCILPIKKEKSLEDFFINRFGQRLYRTFFKDYTEKVWGVACTKIKPEWGAQRIKGLSITKAVLHFIKQLFASEKNIEQKKTETSLIQRFLYPKFGPGQMWEIVTEKVLEQGGEVYMEHRVEKIHFKQGQVASIDVKNFKTGERETFAGDYVISTMPVKNLINAFSGISVPKNVGEVANDLMYRDFFTVGVLATHLSSATEERINIFPDNWIYIQEPDVKVGRLQVFNNWSPFMLKDSTKVWLGLEYFANEGDDLWEQTDEDLIALGKEELEKLDIIKKANILDTVLIRQPKAYPAYFGSYDRFQEIREFTDAIENLFLIGRNGMHRYNNQDHSMLSAMTAVENIINGVTTKENIWTVNTEQTYHEKK